MSFSNFELVSLLEKHGLEVHYGKGCFQKNKSSWLTYLTNAEAKERDQMESEAKARDQMKSEDINKRNGTK